MVILAGGQSQRMGRDKAAIRWKGKTLLGRAIAIAKRAGAREILISGRKSVDYSDFDYPVIFDLKSSCGPLGGIERALKVADSPLVLVIAVDMPQMTSAFLRRLVTGCEEDVGVVPSGVNGLEPLAAVYPKKCHEVLVKALRKRSYSVRRFAEVCVRSGLVRKLEVMPKEQIRFANFNYPEDLRVAKSVRKLGE